MSRAACATIHLSALRHNLERARALAGGARVMAVVKADGYGHGLERVARALAGADAFGVASIEDGERIRRIGLGHRVVVLSGIDEPADIGAMRALALESVIHHEQQVAWLEADATSGPPVRCWLKVDTGMHRLGVAPEQATALHARLRACASVHDEVVLMTHLASSDAWDDPTTARQLDRFGTVTAGLDGDRSTANSAALLGFPASHCDWVRVGGLLYGVAPIAGRTGADFGFRPAMSLDSKLIAINAVARGERIGYGGSYACPHDMRIGVVSIGYGDGYPRHAAPGTPVRIRDAVAPIVGRVSMDLVTVDLSVVPDAAIGDPANLWGPSLPVERVAERADTIGYELICGMTRRVRFVEAG